MLWRRRLPVFAGLVASMFLSACDTVPRQGADASSSSTSSAFPDVKGVIPERIVESLAAADKAQKLGKTSSALEELDDAIRVEPSSKLPWLRKAQIHFDARQYGQAITSAQEVLQRDAHDLTAKSILAVSGLRVSAQALEQLRQANEVSGSARSEAESVSRIIREALGEPILVNSGKSSDGPRPAARPIHRPAASKPPVVSVPATASVTPARTAVAAQPARAGVAAPATTVPQKTTPVASGGTSSSSSRGNNPFGALQ